MQMKDNQGEQNYPAASARKTCQNRRNQYRTECAVQIIMMIFSVVECLFVSEEAIESVGEQSKSVRIRQNAPEFHKPAIARIVGGFRRDQPTGEQVGFRRHQISSSAEICAGLTMKRP